MSLSLIDAKAYIDSMDFSPIINKLICHEGWLMKDAFAISKMYKNFLFLQKKYRDKYNLPPSEEIDEFWHYHILDTKKYRKDCEIIFGEYLDHYPYFGIDEKTNYNDLGNAFKDLLKLYKEEFGEPLRQVKTPYSHFAKVFKKFLGKKPERVEVASTS